MSKPTKAQMELEEWKENLLGGKYGLKPGDELLTDVTHVSKSGMSRSIRIFQLFVDDENKPHIWDMSHQVAKVTGRTLDENNGGVKMVGCGMDVGFALVCELSQELFKGDEKAGYALKQRWL